MNIEPFVYWVNERHAVLKNRKMGKPKPWTPDPILQQYKFCNVRREEDRVTRWIRDNIRVPYADHPNLWFMLAAARQINWPDTLAELIDSGAWPEKSYAPDKFMSVMLDRKNRGQQVYTGAYMITAGAEGVPKAKFTAFDVLLPLWEAQEVPLPTDSLESYHSKLMQHRCFGSFLAAQVVADLKHTRYLKNAADWWDWAAVGPGSARGLNRLHGRPVKYPLKQEQALAEMRELREAAEPYLREVGKLCLQDIQNCLCETDKYLRVKLGEGRPRSHYSDS